MTIQTHPLRLATPGEMAEDVSAVVHEPGRPSGTNVLLAPGAGGDLDGAPLVALADAIAGEGHRVVRVNLPYREAGKKAPPRADRAANGYALILESARAAIDPAGRWIAGGKSYGGRVASLAASEGMPVAGLLFYGYPLHAPGKPEKLRVEHWPHVPVPCLFLQGTHDTFGTIDLFEEHRTKLPRRARVHVVEGGDHSLKIAGKNAPDGIPRAPEHVVADLGPVVAAWIAALD